MNEEEKTPEDKNYLIYVVESANKLVNVINSSTDDFLKLKSKFNRQNNVEFMMDCLYSLIGTMMQSLLSGTDDPRGAFSLFKSRINDVLNNSLMLVDEAKKGKVH